MPKVKASLIDEDITHEFSGYLKDLSTLLGVNENTISIEYHPVVGEECVYVRSKDDKKWVGYMSQFIEQINAGEVNV